MEVRRMTQKILLTIAVALFLILGGMSSGVTGALNDAGLALNAGEYGKALRLYRTLAESGDDQAQVGLAIMYENGLGVPQNYVEAIRWFRKAAQQGSENAQYSLGIMYLEGKSVAKNYDEAAKWFHKAAAQGEANAPYLLGLLYQNGRGVAQNYVQAHKFFDISAANGDEYSRKKRDSIAKEMTPAQITAAQGLARSWTAIQNKVKMSKSGTPAVGDHPKRYRPGDVFKDCDDCPEMVVVPAGEFRMGDLSGGGGDEKPVHAVRIGYVLAVGRFEVTYSEWDACVAGGSCGGYRPDSNFGLRGWHPVANISWNDAKSYVGWLSRWTGKAYRLLSEAEWEYVARAAGDMKYSFGDDERELCAHSNGADIGYPINHYSSNDSNKNCTDGYGRYSALVGSFRANAFGLHDVHGNVKEWVEDCWHDSYTGAPTDGSAWTNSRISGGDCSRRVRRGGSWDIGPEDLRIAKRGSTSVDDRWGDVGFRVARRLYP
jgi:formylglycine-generating enzyme required for sulfatase activity